MNSHEFRRVRGSAYELSIAAEKHTPVTIFSFLIQVFPHVLRLSCINALDRNDSRVDTRRGGPFDVSNDFTSSGLDLVGSVSALAGERSDGLANVSVTPSHGKFGRLASVMFSSWFLLRFCQHSVDVTPCYQRSRSDGAGTLQERRGDDAVRRPCDTSAIVAQRAISETTRGRRAASPARNPRAAPTAPWLRPSARADGASRLPRTSPSSRSRVA